MALPSDLMASLALKSVTNFRASTDYGIDDDNFNIPIHPDDDNFNIGASSLLGFALGLRPSKDIFWTHRPRNCRGNPKVDPKACGRWGADPKGGHTNPGSNCELNAIVATLSTGPVSLADKAGDTNATIVSRCVRSDGRILQPDKPATAVDSTFALDGRSPPGFVWATSTSLADLVWHWILSVDVTTPWKLSGHDLYPPVANTSGKGWLVHTWFTGHGPTVCTNGSRALATGCILSHSLSATDLPELYNTRPIMVQNDTRVFDLTELAPIASNGWVLLGEVGRYVRVSRQRFENVAFTTNGIRAAVSGAIGEVIQIAALQPSGTDWVVIVKQVVFRSTEGMVTFGLS
jgi:hypothetical protein